MTTCKYLEPSNIFILNRAIYSQWDYIPTNSNLIEQKIDQIFLSGL